jgi:LysM repeat protein
LQDVFARPPACMIASGMVGWRNPARYLAPLAIAAVATVAYLIVHKALVHNHTPTPAAIVQTTSSSTGTAHPVSLTARFYVVQPNDTLSKIAARTGVSVSALERLNPTVNPNALHPSQRLRLRR